MEREGIDRRRDRGRRPLRARGDAGRRLRPRRRAVRARHPARTTPPPATALLTALQLLARMAAHRRAAGRAGRGDGPAAAGAGQRAGRRPRPRCDAVRRRAGARSAAAEAELGETGRVLLRPVGHRAAGPRHGRGADEQADAVGGPARAGCRRGRARPVRAGRDAVRGRSRGSGWQRAGYSLRSRTAGVRRGRRPCSSTSVGPAAGRQDVLHEVGLVDLGPDLPGRSRRRLVGQRGVAAEVGGRLG